MFFEVGKTGLGILIRVSLPIDLFTVWTLPELFDVCIFVPKFKGPDSLPTVHQSKVGVIALDTSRQQFQFIHIDLEETHHFSGHVLRLR